MKFSIFILLLFCLLNNKIKAQGSISWVQSYPVKTYPSAVGLNQTSDSGFVFIGDSRTIVKTNKFGGVLWESRLDTFSTAVNLIAPNDSTYIIMGLYNNKNLLISNLNAKGDIRWKKVYSVKTGALVGSDIIQASDTTYMITARYNAGKTFGEDIMLMKVNRGGDSLWMKVFNKAGNQSNAHIQETKNKGFIISAESYTDFPFGNQFPQIKIFMLRTDKLGTIIWENTLANSDSSTAIIDFIQTDSTGFIVIASSFLPPGTGVTYLMRLGTSGNLLWKRKYPNTPTLQFDPVKIIKTTSTDYMIIGITNDYGVKQNNYDYILMNTDTFGTIKNTKLYHYTSKYLGFANRAIRTNDGGFAILGQNSSNALLLKIDQYGKVLGLGLNAFSKNQLNIVYANPVNTNLSIKFSEEQHQNIRGEIYDMIGKKVSVFSIESIENNKQIDVSMFLNGVYFFRFFYSNEQVVFSGKFIKY